MMKLEKSREVKDDRNPPPPPLSLANVLLLQEGPPTPWINRTPPPPPFSLANLLLRMKRIVNSQPYPFGPRRESDSSWMKEEVVYKGLPIELWEDIGKRLSSRLDILRFRSVCKTLRSSLPCPTRFPLRVPPLPKHVDPEEVPCVITEVSVYYQSHWDKGHIVLEEVDQGGKFYAHRRHSGFDLNLNTKIHFPKISFTSSWWWRRPVPYDRLSFISNAHHLRKALPRANDPTKLDYHFNSVASKIALISSDKHEVNPSYVKQSDLSVVALVSEGSMKCRLALLRLKGPSDCWAWDTDFCTEFFVDISSYKGRLCALDLTGGIVMMDFHDSGSLTKTQIVVYWEPIYEMERKMMYENCGELYLACVHEKRTWVTYKIVLDKNKERLCPVPPPKTSMRLAHQISKGRLA